MKISYFNKNKKLVNHSSGSIPMFCFVHRKFERKKKKKRLRGYACFKKRLRKIKEKRKNI